MGVASYREDLLTAYYEGTQSALPEVRSPQHCCPFCGEDFDDRSSLTRHLSSTHRGERPILRVRGREMERSGTIRRAMRADNIEVFNCTSVRMRKDGVALPDRTPDSLRGLLPPETDSVLEITLINEFDLSANPITESYRLVLRIPDKRALDAVDRAFVEVLAFEEPHMSDVDRFLSRSSAQGVAREYADALASYVRGVLIKNGTGGTTLPLREAEIRYGEALDTLDEFHRPLPQVVCGLVRLASNDFSRAQRKTGFRRLDRCHAVLASAVGFTPLELFDGVAGLDRSVGRIVPLCPIDNALDRILDLAEQFKNRRISLEDYRAAVEHPRLTPRDRTKLYALHALAALQSNAAAEARELLRQLRNEYPFGAWASRELDTLDG